MDWTKKPRLRELTPEKILSKIERLPWSGCWIWMGGTTPRGYGIAYHRGQEWAHRLSYRVFVGEPGGQLVLHSCDIPCCVNPAHLHLGDDALNTREAFERGRHPLGSRRPGAKLTDEKVREIKASTLSDQKLAKIYGVGHKTIENIRAGRKWKHVV